MTAPMDLPVSVIICAYTEARWTDLRAAIAALRTQQVPPHEMIVVVDHNPALFERASAELALEGARVLANTGPRGLSGPGTPVWPMPEARSLPFSTMMPSPRPTGWLVSSKRTAIHG